MTLLEKAKAQASRKIPEDNLEERIELAVALLFGEIDAGQYARTIGIHMSSAAANAFPMLKKAAQMAKIVKSSAWERR